MKSIFKILAITFLVGFSYFSIADTVEKKPKKASTYFPAGCALFYVPNSDEHTIEKIIVLGEEYDCS